MTALTHINTGLISICHQIIKILDQKILFYGKVPSLGVLGVDLTVVPDGDLLVLVGIGLVLQFPILFQQPPQLGQVGLDPCAVEHVQGIDGTKVHRVHLELFHGTEH